MKETRTNFKPQKCRRCGREIKRKERCFKSKKGKYLCPECFSSLLHHSPDDTLMEIDVVLPDGRKITVQELV